jgi:hypothetical protein
MFPHPPHIVRYASVYEREREMLCMLRIIYIYIYIYNAGTPIEHMKCLVPCKEFSQSMPQRVLAQSSYRSVATIPPLRRRILLLKQSAIKILPDSSSLHTPCGLHAPPDHRPLLMSTVSRPRECGISGMTSVQCVLRQKVSRRLFPHACGKNTRLHI